MTQMPGMPSGGGGLYWTAADYFRFAQMLLNGGELRRQAHPEEGDCRHDADQRVERTGAQFESGIGQAQFSPAQGFGYDFAVVLDPDAAKRQVGKNSYWWWGIAGTWFWIDPTNDLVCDRHHPAPRRRARRRESRRHVTPGDAEALHEVSGAEALRRPVGRQLKMRAKFSPKIFF